MSEQYEPILIHTIPGPLPPVPEYLIRRRPAKEPKQEAQAFMEAVYAGGEGLVGVDGSGNDWEFPQQLGSLVVNHDAFGKHEEIK